MMGGITAIPAFVPVAVTGTVSTANTVGARCSTRLSQSSFTPKMSRSVRSTTDVLVCEKANKRAVKMLLEQRPHVADLVTDERRKQLAHIVENGPVFQKADMTSLETQPGCSIELNGSCLDDWIQLGVILEEALGEQANDVRVYQYYLPVYFWVIRELKGHLEMIKEKGSKPRPFILGFCCPQGGGKTTMTTFIEKLLTVAGFTSQIASLDDFYVTNAEQRMIAAKNPDNRLLQFRGMPGTHDLPLLIHTLDALRKGKEVWIPRYDKTAFDGRGDRAPKDNWKHLGGGHVDVVLLEGWCLGFEPVPVDTLLDEDLLTVNDALCQFVSIYTRLDGMFVIEIEDMEWVYDWRMQAERATRAAGRPGLTDDQVKDFVSRFMPAYKQYSQPLYNRRTPLCPRHELHISIDEERRPVFRKDL